MVLAPGSVSESQTIRPPTPRVMATRPTPAFRNDVGSSFVTLDRVLTTAEPN